MQFLIPFFSIIFCCLPDFSFAQEVYKNNQLDGYWSGAIIKGNAVQTMNADITKVGDSLIISTEIPDWAYYPPKKSTLTRNGIVLTFDTYYGKATMVLDTVYGEMVGSIGNDIPTLQLHLKKSLKPFVPEVQEKKLALELDGVTLNGKILIPVLGKKQYPCAVLVHGRGCSTMDWQYHRAKKMAEYGLAVVVFDKRGSKNDDIDCTVTTLEQHASDVVKIVEIVRKLREIDAEKVGLIGYSAGGWVAPKAGSMMQKEPAFMVSVVGAATSIKQQQLDGAVYSAKALETTEKGVEQVLRYTELMFSKDKPDEVFEKMQELLKEAKKENWMGWLEDTDIPESASDIPNLWVNRFGNYDPANDLQSLNAPFLSILGETDDIVPYQEQIPIFKDIFAKAGKTNYRLVIAAGAWHNMEHGPKIRNLGYVSSVKARPFYFKFDRVAYGAISEIIDFLRDYGILNN